MAAVNPVDLAGISFGRELAAVAATLQCVTVRVSGRGPGCGSGVIWRPDGLIVTNAHVVRLQTQQVELADGSVFEGRVIVRDNRRDLAAISINAHGLPSMPIRDAHTMRTGEVVIAVGNPLGAAGAVSAGIVHCAPGRHGYVIADIRLAPGNSGGPLADAQGRLVGVNSMIVNGLGWAVPSNVVAAFLSAGSAVGVA